MEEEQDIQSDIVKQKQLRDAQENQEFDRDMDAYRRGRNLTDEERLDRMKDITAKRKLGSRMFDAIEYGAVGSVKWLQKQAEEDPDRYTDDMLRLLGGGLNNISWAISKLPLIEKIAQGEDWLAEQARGMSEYLLPQVDPRFAGWGTRIGTGILGDKAIGKAIKGVKALDRTRRINQVVRGKGRFGQALDYAPTPSQLGTKRELGLQMMAQIETTPEKYARKIQANQPIGPGRTAGYYTVEELDLAQRGPGLEASTPYNLDIRRRIEKVDKSLGVLLQEKYGGTDQQVADFLKIQKEGFAKVKKDVAFLNQKQRRFQKNWIKARVDSGELNLTKDELKDIFRQINNKTYYNIGHIRSAKNVFRYEKLFGANRVTNVFPEIEPNIEWYSTTTGKRIKVVELGNKARKARADAPSDILTMTGTSKTLDEEYLRFIDPEMSEIAFDLMPLGQQDLLLSKIQESWKRFRSAGYPEFSEYLEEVHGINWAKWKALPTTGVWKDLRHHYRKLFNAQLKPVIGKQQFDTFRPFVRKEVDKFMQSIEMGKEMQELFKNGRVQEALDVMYERSKLLD